jgi:predicted outer membrane repeat protein
MQVILPLFFLVTLLNISVQQVYHVMPSDPSLPGCHADLTCFTIDQYLEQPTIYFTTGSTFVFLSGNHRLNATINLRNVSNITLRGDSHAKITTFHSIECQEVSKLRIESLTFLLHPTLNMETWFLKFTNSSKVVIYFSTFQRSGNFSGNYAGAIHATQSTLDVVGCLFRENSAISGGAIYIMKARVLIVNNMFVDNSAEFHGGAVYLSASLVIISGNSFSGNMAARGGGAISSQYSNVTIGGTSDSDSLSISNCCVDWSLNTTSQYYDTTLSTILDLFVTTVNKSGAYFAGNAGGKGGAVYALNSNVTLNGTVVVFKNNTASKEGGALCVKHKSMVIMKARCMYFIGNEAKTGGAISTVDVTLLIGGEGNAIHVYFLNNSANNAGAIHFQGIENCTVLGNSYFVRNNAFENGGAIATLYGALTISGAIFYANSASLHGGAIASSSHRFTLSGPAIFQKNKANHCGGAIIFETPAHVALNGATINFNENSAKDGGAIYVKGSKLTAVAEVTRFSHNTAQRRGGGIFVTSGYFGHSESILIMYANFTNNTAATCGGALYVHTRAHIHFDNIFAFGNSGSALCFFGGTNVSFSGTTNISKNTGTFGGGVSVTSQSSFLKFVDYSVFDGNNANLGGAMYLPRQTIMLFSGFVLFKNNSAHEDGGALYAIGTDIVIDSYGRMNFSYNSAQNGGAMHLSTSFLTFNYMAKLFTTCNYASKYGGGIYHEDVVTTSQCNFYNSDTTHVSKLPYCFLKFCSASGDHYRNKARAISYNDSSGNGGSFIYGGLLDRCQFNMISEESSIIVPYEYFLENFFQSVTAIAITSDPYQLCFCESDDNYDCLGEKNITIYRGQKFNISLLALNQLRHCTSTNIASVLTSAGRLNLNSQLQTLKPVCYNLTYNIYSTEDSERLQLYTDGPCHDTGVATAIINVMFLPCPDGFRKLYDQCTCEERLRKYNVNCTIYEGVTITKNAGSKLWIGALYENETYQGLILYDSCPMGYCWPGTIDTTLTKPDLQCDRNRNGLLCGSCIDSYSLMFASSKCKECSNTYLVLILPFAAAGIALVIFLSIMRLTVATGMMNSVIFYANIVQANKNQFLHTNRNVLTVFIAWLNFDLGIETCFYNGMTAYIQTWLQFAFPVYMWILVTLIILGSRYSITLSKVVGHNPIAVLATLLLLSYTKILKVTIDVFSFVHLDYPRNKTAVVWLKDGNVPYLQSWHLLLAVVTSLVFVLLFLPYTFLLLLGYKLHRFSGRKSCRWLNRLKPLLDSYYAPYKTHTRYWTGFLLLVRCAMYIVFSFNSLGATDKSLFAIIIVCTIIGLASRYANSGKIYKNISTDIIENSTYLNLIVLSAATLAGFNSAALVYTLIGIVYATLMGITLYHFHITYTVKTAIWLKIRTRTVYLVTSWNNRTAPITDHPISTASSHDPHKIISKTVIELREPLLDSSVVL